MGEFIYFTEEQKERANAVSIADILQKEHGEVERSGNEWRWMRHNSVTFRGNGWYRHSQQAGSGAFKVRRRNTAGRELPDSDSRYKYKGKR